jgi:hypothetical protein
VAVQEWRRYVAPAAFLLTATVAVVLIRAGLESGERRGGTPARTARAASPGHVTTKTTTTARSTRKRSRARRFWTVQPGDTFGVISSKTGVSVATIVRLNPKASSTSLFVGEKLRVR